MWVSLCYASEMAVHPACKELTYYQHVLRNKENEFSNDNVTVYEIGADTAQTILNCISDIIWVQQFQSRKEKWKQKSLLKWTLGQIMSIQLS